MAAVAEKTIESVAVQVDETALAPLGWTARDVRARLVTEPTLGGQLVQRVAVAGTADFEAERWTELSSRMHAAPRLLLTLNRRGSTGMPGFTQVVAEGFRAAARGPVRFTETSRSIGGAAPVMPDDLEIRLTGFDFDNVNSEFGLPGDRVATVPVTVVDESTWPSLPVTTQADAEITREALGEHLRLHIDGVLEPGTTQELIADHVAHGPEPFDVASLAPRLRVPGFIVEVTDDTEFLLAKRTILFNGAVIIENRDERPRRPLSFVAEFRAPSITYAGTPAQIVVRIRDAANLQVP